MKIALIHNKCIEAEGAGSTQTATQLVDELVGSGHDVTVYCASVPSTLNRNNGVEIVDLGIPADNTLIPDQRYARIVDAIRDRAHEFDDYDVVHSYTLAIAGLADVARETSTATVVTLNGYRPLCPKKDLYFMDSEPCRENGGVRCSRCIVNSLFTDRNSSVYGGASLFDTYDGILRLPASAYVLAGRFRILRSVLNMREAADQITLYHVQANHIRDIYGKFNFPDEKIRVVPNILDEQFLVPHTSGFTEPYRLLYVGTLSEKKGSHKLVPTFDLLQAGDIDGFEMTIIGDGHLKPRVEREASDRGLNIDVRGHVDYADLPEIYAAHDLFIYPGVWEEPFARVFLETMATGTPLVGSQVGDLEAILGEAGVVTDGSPAELATAIQQIIRDNRLESMSKAGKQRAEDFRPAAIIPQMEHIYREAIELDSDLA